MLNQIPDLCVWKKDKNLQYTDMNDTAARVFGFGNRENAIGKCDYDIPSGLSIFADIFRENDSQIIKNETPRKFLEIQPCANNEWKILHVAKNPYYEKGRIAGVIAYSVDITKTYMKIEQFFMPNKTNTMTRDATADSNFKKNPQLNARESECLFFLLRKCTAKEIANFLKISHRTVEYYIEELKLKFFCGTKIDLIHTANTLGYFNIIPTSIMQKQLSIMVD